jgi:hypothetical protein
LQALSKIHISFDGWTTKGSTCGFLGVVGHCVDSHSNLQHLPIALPQLTGAHSGKKMAEVVSQMLQQFIINSSTVSYFVHDNTSNNNSAVAAIAQKMDFDATHHHICCGSHTLNSIGQVLL